MLFALTPIDERIHEEMGNPKPNTTPVQILNQIALINKEVIKLAEFSINPAEIHRELNNRFVSFHPPSIKLIQISLSFYTINV